MGKYVFAIDRLANTLLALLYEQIASVRYFLLVLKLIDSDLPHIKKKI